MSFIVDLARILRELASEKFLCWVLATGEFDEDLFFFVSTDLVLISTF